MSEMKDVEKQKKLKRMPRVATLEIKLHCHCCNQGG